MSRGISEGVVSKRKASKWMTKIKKARDSINKLLEEKKDIKLSSEQRNELENIIDDLCHNLYVKGFEDDIGENERR